MHKNISTPTTKRIRPPRPVPSQDYALLVDAHVHVHGCFELGQLLDGAVAHFQKAAPDKPWLGVLMLADMAGQNTFGRLACSTCEECPGWSFRRTREETSLVAYHHGHARLVFVAGRQLVSTEGIELLALATRADLHQRQPLDTLCATVTRNGGIPVLPWGFGKWAFRRGSVVEKLLESQQREDDTYHTELFLGDSALRARYGRQPNLFGQAADLGMRVLAGSDPLPFARQAGSAGRYGFVLHGHCDLDRPTQSLRKLLRCNTEQPQTFGCRDSLTSFCRNQIAMQKRKRLQ